MTVGWVVTRVRQDNSGQDARRWVMAERAVHYSHTVVPAAVGVHSSLPDFVRIFFCFV